MLWLLGCGALIAAVHAVTHRTLCTLRSLFRFPPREAVAVLVMGSQKTMPFAVSIISLLPASLGAKGLLTLPPLIAQISQLFCDVWIGAHFRRKARRASPTCIG